MPILEIELSTEELLALDLIAVDKQEWADNFLTNRARVAKEDLKPTPEWAQALALHIQAGGDPVDDWAVLAIGCSAGLFKTAAQKQQEELPPPPVPEIPTAPTGTYNLPKQQPFIRATDEEAVALEAILNAAPARLRMIYQGATHINSGDELFGTLMGMIVLALGGDEAAELRAAELLAPLE